MKFLLGVSTAILAVSMTAAALGACAPGATIEKLKVATSTSLLTYIVQQVGGDKVDVFHVVPESQHPGDFDARPGDVQRLAQASLFLVHGFPGETYVPGLVASASNPNLKVVTAQVDGNWMTPPVQLAATDKVAAALSEADPENGDLYESRATGYKERVRAKEAEVRNRLAGADIGSLKAISAGFQAGFAGWAGIKVVGTYATPESLTAQAVKELVDKGRAEGVNLIIDNVHSGKDAGRGLAEELGAKRIILVNFPGGFENTETWEKAMDYNVGEILKAAAR